MNTKELSGKVALITGASHGIGRISALLLADAGAKVVVASRNKEGDLGNVAEEIKSKGGSALAIPANIGRGEDINNLVSQTLKAFGRIDILVNNAATNPVMTPLIELEERTWDHIMNVNLKGYFLLSQKVAKEMVKQGGGTIINMASEDGIKTWPGMIAYGISKAGVIALTQGLAKELGQYNIRVNAIAPGLIRTKFSEAAWSDEKQLKERMDKTVLKRLGEPEEIARMVLFLASSASSYMTGTTVCVEGGALIV